MKTKDNEENKPCDLSDLMDTFGKYQVIHYILICLPTLWVTMISINYVFVAEDIEYRCHIDECEDSNSTSQFPSWWPDTSIDRCSKPVLRSGETVCANNSFTGELETCDKWIYENNDTVVAKLHMACHPWSLHLIGTIHSTGMLVSVFFFGWLSDKIGRKPVFLICVVGGCIGNLKTIATSYYMYVAIEFLEATMTGGTYPSAVVLFLEMTGGKYRILAGVVVAYAVCVGEALLALIAKYVQHWKSIVHIINAPVIFFIALLFFLNESPRWQIVMGKVEKTKKLLKKIADNNNIPINEEELSNINEATLKKKFNFGENEVKESYVNVFKSKEITKRVFVIFVSRFTTSLVYYGLIINSVWLPGDKYVIFFLSAMMSIPGELICLYLMMKVGRKMPLLIGYFASSILCVISALIPKSCLWLKLTLFLIGKAIISICFTGIITYNMELFPTSVRGSLMGLGALASRLGGMLAPLTPIMISVSEILPLVCFCFFSVITGSLLTLTPETKYSPLFDTIAQFESFQQTNPDGSVEKGAVNTSNCRKGRRCIDGVKIETKVE